MTTPGTSSAAGLNILVLAHGHPDFSMGGGEVAAHALCQAYRRHPGVAQATLLARAEDPSGWPDGRISLRREGEYLWHQAAHDTLHWRSAHRASVFTELAAWVQAVRPDVVHAHHFVHLGLDVLVALRRWLPQAAIYLTLHEYMAICHHGGQMVRPDTHRLCEQATPHDCQRCFPALRVEDFWLRRELLLGRMGLLDGFIAPSEFLRQRYIAWGLPAERIHLIDNAPADIPAVPARALALGEGRRRFGFFGQINPRKGLDVLLQALVGLTQQPGGLPANVPQLWVNAAHLEHQSLALRERIAGYLDRLVPAGVVQWRGPYAPHELPRRMAEVDWVVVPSVWWENSPLVIQEAFAAGRPVVCSDIGGMAEKVQHGHNGWHVPVGNTQAWGHTLAELAHTPGLWERLVAGVAPVARPADWAQAHLALFQQTLCGKKYNESS